MNSVPWLRKGVGRTPAEGGCIMQVIDWIHRNEWTDSPPCVHPVLRAIAIQVNDLVDDERRQELLDLSPRLMGTASDDGELSAGLAIWCVRQVLHIFEEQYPNDDRPRKAIEAAERRDFNIAVSDAAYSAAAPSDDCSAPRSAAYAAASAHACDNTSAACSAAHAAGGVDFLIGCIDEYDRLTGRTKKTTEITEESWFSVCAVMA